MRSRSTWRGALIGLCLWSSGVMACLAQGTGPDKPGEPAKVVQPATLSKRWYSPSAALGNSELTLVLNRAFTILRDRPDDVAACKAAIIELQERIVAQPGDAFVTDSVPPSAFENEGAVPQMSLRSIKQVAENGLGELSEKLRGIYELAYGGEARTLLMQGTKSGDREPLQEVVRLYVHTEAGHEAAYQLASRAIDQRQWAVAFPLLRRLSSWPRCRERFDPLLTMKFAAVAQHLGRDKEAAAIVSSLSPAARSRLPASWKNSAGEIIAERLAKWSPSESRRVLGLTDWSHFLGSASREGSAAGVGLTDLRLWEMSTFGSREKPTATQLSQQRYTPPQNPNDDDEWAPPVPKSATDVEAAIQVGHEWVLNREKQARELPLPATHPLVMNGTVVLRTLNRVRAVDLKSGEVKWESSAIDPAFSDLFPMGDRWKSLRDRISQSSNSELFSPLHAFQQAYLTSRTRWDRTVGTLSSDGQRVFFLDACGVTHPATMSSIYDLKAMVPQHWNRLCAVDLKSGRALWEIGAPSPTDSAEGAGLFCLGAPTVVNGKLYALAESTGSVRLLCLDPATGQQVWQEPVLEPSESISSEALRRVSADSPTYVDGLLLCPTSNGFLAAYDLEARRMAWLLRYPTNSINHFIGGRGVQREVPRMRFEVLLRSARWNEASLQAASGRLFLAAADSNQLHAVDLFTGELLWSKLRQDGLHVATADSESVVIVGRRQIRALNANDGAVKWSRPLGDRVPTGRGLRSGSVLHVPVARVKKSDAVTETVDYESEVVSIDLNDGRILSTTPGPRDGLLGNLAAGDGAVVSQWFDRLVAYPSLAEIESQLGERLTRNANDAEALIRRGRLRLQQGRRSDGLADLARGVKEHRNDAAKQLFVDVVIESRQLGTLDAEELKSLVRQIDATPDVQRRVLTVEADVLLAAGKPLEALRLLLGLIELSRSDERLAEQRGNVTFFGPHIVSSQLAATYHAALETAVKADLQAFDREVRGRLEAALKTEGPTALREFVKWFAWHPLANEARWELLTSERLKPKADFQERERLALRALQDESTLGAGALALLGHWVQADRAVTAITAWPDFERRYGELKLPDGKTVAAKWGELKLGEGNQPQPKRTSWSEAVQVQAGDPQPNGERRQGVPFVGRVSPVLRHAAIELLELPRDADGEDHANLVGRDGLGATNWVISLDGGGLISSKWAGPQLRSNGHLAALSVNGWVAVLDFAAAEKPTVLWVKPLLDFVAAFGPQMVDSMAPDALVQTEMYSSLHTAYTLEMGFGQRRYTGSLDLLTSDYVVYRTDDRLHVVDLITGQRVWSRSGVPHDATLIGDDEHLVVAANDGRSLIVRLLDGEIIARPMLPSGNRRLTVVGRDFINWTEANPKRVVMRVDSLTGNPVWQTEPAALQHLEAVDQDEIWMIEKTGRAAVLDPISGRQWFGCDLGLNEIRDAQIFPHPQGYSVTLGGMLKPNDEPIAAGRLLGLNFNGQKLWERDLDMQTLWGFQPRDLPLFVRFGLGGKRLADGKLVMEVIDRRNGRVLWSESPEALGNAAGMKVSSDRQKLEVFFQKRRYSIQFER